MSTPSQDSEPNPLDWGHHYLTCAPGHFQVLYEINPWMHREIPADPEAANAQWEQMVANLRTAGAIVEYIDPVSGLPDMVFTANFGVVDARGHRFVASRFAHLQRMPESEQAIAWFAEREYEIVELGSPSPGPGSPGTAAFTPSLSSMHFEGAGDALPFRDKLVAGYRIRSDFDAHTELGRLLDVGVLSVELVDQRFYHLDLTFCPLDDRHAIIAPDAWDRYGRAVIEQLVPEPLALELDEALTFCANSVVIGTTIVMPECPPRVGRILEGWGFDVCVSPVEEFLKAGGGVRCLTLALDTVIGHRQRQG